jgi:two-component system cell cycle response regulator DivK
MDRFALIIDDNQSNLEALGVLLKKEGITPVMAQSPRDIPAIMDRMPRIDVVFLDLEFPNHNGFQLVSQLKQMEHLQDAPVVAYSVHVSELNEVRAAGFHSFIGKPLSVERFPDQLRRILRGQSVWEVG